MVYIILHSFRRFIKAYCDNKEILMLSEGSHDHHDKIQNTKDPNVKQLIINHITYQDINSYDIDIKN